MPDRREFARQQADAFVVRTLDSIGKVLEDHSRGVADFAYVMQVRLDAAETMLADVAACNRIGSKAFKRVTMHVDLLERIDALIAEMKARTN